MSIFKISLLSVQIDVEPKASPDFPFHRTIFRYTKEDWAFDLIMQTLLSESSSNMSGLQNFCPRLRM